ncbi:exodeoxyribonuclease I [Aquariibacter albus]|uniref:Exodeoxyribonuclease I n=1 Tax=Aquariibacter albus TaxID=2759899 RepID=A0A839HRK4_9BURK|nr:exodeoxyribonuclease I [Aquariibacter albus]MBB1160454.1 exodeoxyribonuclease I [Aquariibacter albus]
MHDDFSFFWHDYEAWGRDPRRTRPAQFAGVRTDADLNEIDEPVSIHCQPPTDLLPEPGAVLLTGITPQLCAARGLPEHAFAAAIEAQLARPGTVGVGYNSIRYDDEVTRFLFWRNLMDPYAREWQNRCGRWDLLDVMRACHALRPEGLVWPRREDGHTSFRLEDLTAANGIAHASAHDALSDVRATLALARKLHAAQPRLWAFCLKLRSKQAVKDEFAAAERAGRPLLHISGMYGAERGGLALVWPLAPHPTNGNEVLVWDCAEDPAVLGTLDVEGLRQRLFTRREALPEGLSRLPIKGVHLNKSPIVVSHLGALGAAQAARWGIDLDAAQRHAEAAATLAPRLAGLWPEVYRRPEAAADTDVDEDLYGGFLAEEDRRSLARLLALPADERAGRLAGGRQPAFHDGRLDELLFRYRARNFPDTLDAEAQARWEAHRAARLHHGAAGALTLEAFLAEIDGLAEAAETAGDERAQGLLEALVDWATEIAPDAD